MTTAEQQNIRVLFIVRWYPNPEDPQLGIFIKKHAQAVALYADVAVLYITPFYCNMPAERATVSVEKNVRRLVIHYSYSKIKILSFYAWIKAVIRSHRVISENFGKPDLVHAHVLTRPAVVALLFS